MSAAVPVDSGPVDSGPVDSGTATGRGLRHAFRALRHRDFALFWSGALASNVGTWMQQVTVPFVLFNLTGSAAWIGLAAFLQFFPMMAMNSVGGVLADRFSRKRILLVTQMCQMGVALGLFAIWQTHNARPGLLVAVVSVGGVIAGIQSPAWQSFVPQLVPRESLLNAVTLNSAQFNGSRAIGPALAGLVLAGWGPGAAFLANACSYLFVLAALAGVRSRPPALERARGTVRGEMGDGFRYVRAHRGIGLAIALVAVAGILGAPVVQFTPVFAEEVFRVGEAAYGLLTAAFGTGAVIGAVVLGAYADDVRRSRLAVAGLAAFGLGAFALGVSPDYAEGLAALLAMGAAYIVIASSLNTSIQLLVREEMRGRTMAFFMMAFAGGFPFGALIQGRVADAVGVQATVAGAGGLLIGVAFWLVTRSDLIAALDSQPALEGAVETLPGAGRVAVGG